MRWRWGLPAWSADSERFESDIKRAEELAMQAVAAEPRNAIAHFAKGQALRVQKRYEEAIPEYETALEVNRNWVGALFALGWCKFHAGFIEQMIPVLKQVIRLSPRDPYLGIWYARIGVVYMLQSRTDEAINWLEKARNGNPVRAFTRAALAAAYSLKGEAERAAIELAEAQKLSRDDRYSSITRVKAVGDFGVAKVQALFETTFFHGLRKAGLPEQ